MMKGKERIYSEVLIIGGGLAALRAAIEAKKYCEHVTVLSKKKIGRSGNTIISGCLFSASIPPTEIEDSPENHFHDTLVGGKFVNNRELVRILVQEAPKAILDIEHMGVRFFKTSTDFVRTSTPGHTKPRTITTKYLHYPFTSRGLSITIPLLLKAKSMGVRLLENIMVLKLLVDNGQVQGAIGLNRKDGKTILFLAKAVVIASGGGGKIYQVTTNTLDMTGDSYAMALKAGVTLQDMEFVQFHPLMAVWPIPVTMPSPLLGDGAILRNCYGTSFMERYCPRQKDMATRDEMSRAIYKEIQEGRGIKKGIYFDCSSINKKILYSSYLQIVKLFHKVKIDLLKDFVIVSPAVHFFMGGIRIDKFCQTSISGLFAAGEAGGGIHGSNRLTGNALIEALVFGARAGKYAAKYAGCRHKVLTPSYSMMKEVKEVPKDGKIPLKGCKSELSNIMWDNVSIIRSEKTLMKAIDRLDVIKGKMRNCIIQNIEDLIKYCELKNMILVAEAITYSALTRKESRGSHYREDYPGLNNQNYLGNILIENKRKMFKCKFIPMS